MTDSTKRILRERRPPKNFDSDVPHPPSRTKTTILGATQNPHTRDLPASRN